MISCYLKRLADAGLDDRPGWGRRTSPPFFARLREGDDDHPPLLATYAGRTVVAVRGLHRFACGKGLAPGDPAARAGRLRYGPHTLRHSFATHGRRCWARRVNVSPRSGAMISSMSSQTSTIRVTRATRDLLAKQARERGVSLAALLSEIADERRREAVWRSEREACRIDAQNPAAQTELREWEATLEDGLD